MVPAEQSNDDFWEDDVIHEAAGKPSQGTPAQVGGSYRAVATDATTVGPKAEAPAPAEHVFMYLQVQTAMAMFFPPDNYRTCVCVCVWGGGGGISGSSSGSHAAGHACTDRAVLTCLLDQSLCLE